MPVSIWQSACDIVTIWLKAWKKQILCRSFVSRNKIHHWERRGGKNSGLWTLIWSSEAAATPGFSPHSSKELLNASTTLGPSWRFLECSKAKKKKKKALGKDGGLINIPVFVWFSPESQRPPLERSLRGLACWKITSQNVVRKIHSGVTVPWETRTRNNNKIRMDCFEAFKLNTVLFAGYIPIMHCVRCSKPVAVN